MFIFHINAMASLLEFCIWGKLSRSSHCLLGHPSSAWLWPLHSLMRMQAIQACWVPSPAEPRVHTSLGLATAGQPRVALTPQWLRAELRDSALALHLPPRRTSCVILRPDFLIGKMGKKVTPTSNISGLDKVTLST